MKTAFICITAVLIAAMFIGYSEFVRRQEIEQKQETDLRSTIDSEDTVLRLDERGVEQSIELEQNGEKLGEAPDHGSVLRAMNACIDAFEKKEGATRDLKRCKGEPADDVSQSDVDKYCASLFERYPDLKHFVAYPGISEPNPKASG